MMDSTGERQRGSLMPGSAKRLPDQGIDGPSRLQRQNDGSGTPRAQAVRRSHRP